MTSFSDIRTAVKAIKAGAYEYITKPVNPDELLMILQQALNKEKAAPAVETGSQSIVLGSSEVARELGRRPLGILVGNGTAAGQAEAVLRAQGAALVEIDEFDELVDEKPAPPTVLPQ